jgi:hypothetical protein
VPSINLVDKISNTLQRLLNNPTAPYVGLTITSNITNASQDVRNASSPFSLSPVSLPTRSSQLSIALGQLERECHLKPAIQQYSSLAGASIKLLFFTPISLCHVFLKPSPAYGIYVIPSPVGAQTEFANLSYTHHKF